MRRARLLAVALTTVLALSACSGGDGESTGDAPEATDSPPAPAPMTQISGSSTMALKAPCR